MNHTTNASLAKQISTVAAWVGDTFRTKLGKRIVTVELPPAVRSGLAREAKQAKSLLTRAVLSLVPAGPRARLEVRAELKVFNRRLGNALSVLSASERNPQEVKNALGKFVQDAQGLIRLGADFEQALGGQLDLALKKFEYPQLVALAAGAVSVLTSDIHAEYLQGDRNETRLALQQIAERADTLLQAMQARREVANVDLGQTFQALASSARSGSLGDALGRAEQVYQALQNLSGVYQAQDSRLDDAGERKAFLDEHLSLAVGNLSAEEQAAMKAFFAQADVQNLSLACRDLGALQSMVARQPKLAARLDTMAQAMEMLTRATGNPMPVRAPEIQASHVGSDLSEQAVSAILGHFGVVVGGNGKASLSAEFIPKHEGIRLNNFSSPTFSRPSEDDGRFSETFVKDIGRASYTIDGKVMDKGSPDVTKQALIDFAQNDVMTMAASKAANQMLILSVNALLTLPPGVLSLPDGRVFRPTAGDAAHSSMHFAIGRNATGEITVMGRMEYSDIKQVVEVDANGQSPRIDMVPGGEMAFSIEVTIAADGAFRVSRQPEFEFGSFIAA